MNAIAELDDAQKDKLSVLLGPAKKGQERTSLSAELRKTGNGLRGLADGQIEAPGGAKQRDFIRRVFTGILGKVREQNPDTTMADLQALVWYPEKRLYDASKTGGKDVAEGGYDDSEAPEYANAAAQLARNQGVGESAINKAIKDVDNELQATKRARDSQRADRGSGAQAETTATEIRKSPGRTDAQPVSQPGGVRGGDGVLAGTGRPYQGDGRQVTSLEGLPEKVTANGRLATTRQFQT